MATLNWEHLLDQADQLISTERGKPRQVDLRRAISAAYYAIFHAIATALADEFVGKSRRGSPRYALVYRSLSHRDFRNTCIDLAKLPAPNRFRPYLPVDGIGDDLRGFLLIAADLQSKRHEADYDPIPRFNTADAKSVIQLAWLALDLYDSLDGDRRRIFLTLLLAPPR